MFNLASASQLIQDFSMQQEKCIWRKTASCLHWSIELVTVWLHKPECQIWVFPLLAIANIIAQVWIQTDCTFHRVFKKNIEALIIYVQELVSFIV